MSEVQTPEEVSQALSALVVGPDEVLVVAIRTAVTQDYVQTLGDMLTDRGVAHVAIVGADVTLARCPRAEVGSDG